MPRRTDDRQPRITLVLTMRDLGGPDDPPFDRRLAAWIKTGLRRDRIRLVSIAPAPAPEEPPRQPPPASAGGL